MEQASADNTNASGNENPVDRSGLCLLSLDGGGVRGLSTLYILRNIMTRLNHERSKSGLSTVKPCEVFDLIGGTSTGGLIAIMLGRLEMDVDACIAAYNRLIKVVFEDKLRSLPLGLSGWIKPKFDSKKLAKAVEGIIKEQGLEPSEKFNNGKDRGCRVFVCTAATNPYMITRLRSYDLPAKSSLSATICEAALATSAATGFFDPVSIGSRQFVDGALGVNNPAEEVEGEASDIWCDQTADLKPLVKCFISIGTGNPGQKAIEDKALKFLSKTLVAITTETEETARRFIARWRQHYDERRYFRLNVEQGLQDVGLEEYKECGKIENATNSYLDDQAQVFGVRDCVKNLQQKQNKVQNALTQQVYVSDMLTFRFLAYAVQKPQMNSPPNQAPHKHWTVSRSPNRHFTGRDTILSDLETTVRAATSNSSQCRIVITGMGGQGKSEICLQLVHRLREIFWGVFWVDVTTPSSAETDFLTIARKIGVSAEKWPDVGLALANTSETWLLVLDNADDPDTDYGQYFPSGRSSVVLLTSRNAECKHHTTNEANHIALEELTDLEAQKLLLDAAEVPPDQRAMLSDEAQAVTTLLKSHPLALLQAGSYIKQDYCSLHQYPAVFQKHRSRLLDFSLTQARSVYGNVRTTFEVSAEKLSTSNTKRANDALDLLSILAVCAPRALPLVIFENAWHQAREWVKDEAYVKEDDWCVLQFPSFLDTSNNSWDDFRLQEAVNELKRFSLVSTNHYQAGLSISTHPLVHAWAMERLCDDEKHQAWVTAGCVFRMLDWDGHLWRLHQRQLFTHVQELLSHRMSIVFADALHEEITPLLVGLGWLLARSRRDLALSMFLVRLYEHLGLDCAKVDENHLRLYELRAVNLRYLGKSRESIALLDQSLKITERTVTEDDPRRLASQHELASAYRGNGQIKEAISLLEHVVKIREQTVTEDDSRRLASQHTLAQAYRGNGQIKEAISLLEHVVKIREQTVTEDDPRRLASQRMLAICYWDDDRRTDAVRIMQHVVEVQSRVLDKDHPDRRNCQRWLEFFQE